MAKTAKRGSTSQIKYPEAYQSPPAVIDANRRYDIGTASAILRQSPAKTFQEIRSGKLASFKDGRLRFIHGSELIRASSPPSAA